MPRRPTQPAGGAETARRPGRSSPNSFAGASAEIAKDGDDADGDSDSDGEGDGDGDGDGVDDDGGGE